MTGPSIDDFINRANGGQSSSLDEFIKRHNPNAPSSTDTSSVPEQGGQGALAGILSVPANIVKGVGDVIENPAIVPEAIWHGIQGLFGLGKGLVTHPIDTVKSVLIDGILKPLILDPIELGIEALPGVNRLTPQQEYQKAQEATANWAGLFIGYGLGKLTKVEKLGQTAMRMAEASTPAEVAANLHKLEPSTLLKLAAITSDPAFKPMLLEKFRRGVYEGLPAGMAVGLGSGNSPEERWNNAFSYGIAGAVIGSGLEVFRKAHPFANLPEQARGIAYAKMRGVIETLPPDDQAKVAVRLSEGMDLPSAIQRSLNRGEATVIDGMDTESVNPNVISHLRKDGLYNVLINGHLDLIERMSESKIKTDISLVGKGEKLIGEYNTIDEARAGRDAHAATNGLSNLVNNEFNSVYKFKRVEITDPNSKWQVYQVASFPKQATVPLRMYHGTSHVYDTPDLSKDTGDNLYGPGFYATESPEIAGGVLDKKLSSPEYPIVQHKGYADLNLLKRETNRLNSEINYAKSALATHEQTLKDYASSPNHKAYLIAQEMVGKLKDEIVQKQTELADFNINNKRASNVRPVYVDMRNPFDIDGAIEPLDARKILDIAAHKGNNLRTLNFFTNKSVAEGLYGDELYRFMENELDKKTINEVLKEAGYDGIIHTGGQIHNISPHRVAIAFDAKQVIPFADFEALSFSAKDIASFKSHGFIHNEVVKYNGKEQIIHEANKDHAILIDPETGATTIARTKSLRHLDKIQKGVIEFDDTPGANLLDLKEIPKPDYDIPSIHGRLSLNWRKHKLTFANAFDEAAYTKGESTLTLRNDLIQRTGISPESLAAHKLKINKAVSDLAKQADDPASPIMVPSIPLGEARTVPKEFAVKSVAKIDLGTASKTIADDFNDIIKRLDVEDQIAIAKNKEKLDLETASSLDNLITQAGMNNVQITSLEGGRVQFFDKNGKSIGIASTVEEAKKLMPSSSGGGNVPTIPGASGDNFYAPNPKGPVGTSEYGIQANKSERFTSMLKIRMGNFIPRAELAKAFDTLFKTELYSNFVFKLRNAMMQFHASRAPWLERAKNIVDTHFSDMSQERLETVSDYMETQSPDEIVKSMFKDRALNDNEIRNADAMVQRAGNVDAIKKAYRFIEYERDFTPTQFKKWLKTQPPLEANELAVIKQMKEIRAEDIDALSLDAITKLARAKLLNTPNKADFAIANKMTAKEIGAAHALAGEFSKLAPIFGIDTRLLTAYLPHLRTLGDLEAKKMAAGVNPTSDLYKRMTANERDFFASLTRSGELNDIIRNPIELLVKYINYGFRARDFEPVRAEAKGFLDQTAIDVSNLSTTEFKGQSAKAIQQFGDRYMGDLQGIISGEDALANAAFDSFMGKVSNANAGQRSSFINAFMRTAEFAAQGFKPLAGARDAATFGQIYMTRFGFKRFNNMMRTWHEAWKDGEGLENMGEIPGIKLSQVNLEQGGVEAGGVINKIAGKSDSIFKKMSEYGFKFSAQPTVYQMAHAMSFLETRGTVAKAVSDLTHGLIDRAKFDKEIGLKTYDTAIAKYFNTLIDEGDYGKAVEYLSKVTGEETVGYYGLASHPYFMSNRFGRLLGQFGQWPLWYMNVFNRMMVRGGVEAKGVNIPTGVALRLGATLAAISATRQLTGIDLSNWNISPSQAFSAVKGGPFLQTIQSLAQSMNSSNSQEKNFAVAELKRVFDFSSPSAAKKIYVPIPFQLYDTIEGIQRFANDDPMHIAGAKILGFRVDTNQYPKP